MTRPVNTILAISIVVVIAVIAGGVIWYQFSQQAEEIAPVTQQTQQQEQVQQNEQPELAGWKTYVNLDLGIEFKYPENWSSSCVDSKYSKTCFGVEVMANNITNLPATCEDLRCLSQKQITFMREAFNSSKTKIDDFFMVVEFAGTKGILQKNCSVEGAPPLSPIYKVEFIKNNRLIAIFFDDFQKTWPIVTVDAFHDIRDSNEVAKDNKANEESVQNCTDYIKKINMQEKIDGGADYKTWNDFINVLSTFKFTK